MNRKVAATFFTATTAFIICSCTQHLSGVETTNGNGFTISATTTSVEGTAPPLSQVFLFDTNYIPYVYSGTAIATTADIDGNYSIAAHPVGCRLFVITPKAEAAGVSREISPIENVAAVPRLSYTMQPPGSVYGTVSQSSDSVLLVYLAGMCHYELLSSRRDFHFTTVAAGTYRLRLARLPYKGKGTIALLHDQAVTVRAGEAVNVGVIDIP